MGCSPDLAAPLLCSAGAMKRAKAGAAKTAASAALFATATAAPLLHAGLALGVAALLCFWLSATVLLYDVAAAAPSLNALSRVPMLSLRLGSLAIAALTQCVIAAILWHHLRAHPLATPTRTLSLSALASSCALLWAVSLVPGPDLRTRLFLVSISGTAVVAIALFLWNILRAVALKDPEMACAGADGLSDDEEAGEAVAASWDAKLLAASRVSGPLSGEAPDDVLLELGVYRPLLRLGAGVLAFSFCAFWAQLGLHLSGDFTPNAPLLLDAFTLLLGAAVLRTERDRCAAPPRLAGASLLGGVTAAAAIAYAVCFAGGWEAGLAAAAQAVGSVAALALFLWVALYMWLLRGTAAFT